MDLSTLAKLGNKLCRAVLLLTVRSSPFGKAEIDSRPREV